MTKKDKQKVRFTLLVSLLILSKHQPDQELPLEYFEQSLQSFVLTEQERIL
jgi:hypothetical protein